VSLVVPIAAPRAAGGSWPRFRRALVPLAIAAAFLAGCARGDVGVPMEPAPAGQAAAAAPTGEVIGNGAVTIGLVLPLGGELGQQFKNSAALAYAEFPQANLKILVKDDGGSEAGARAAAQAAIGEGAQLVLGPIFAPAVAGAASVARPANVPIVAFSTDATVASRGVNLLSFLPSADVERIISFAGSQGKRSFAALVPENGYGLVVEAAFREVAGRAGGRVVAVERYRADRSDLAAKAQALSAYAGQIDALLVPEGGEGGVVVARALQGAGFTGGRVQLLGTGQWDDPRIAGDPAFAGAWYAAADRAGFDAFATRYAARYGGGVPPRAASLAYDATTLAAGLVRAHGAGAFSEAAITNPNGFIGVNGLFRFTTGGLNQRGLAVYEVVGGAARVKSPAPRTFQAGS